MEHGESERRCLPGHMSVAMMPAQRLTLAALLGPKFRPAAGAEDQCAAVVELDAAALLPHANFAQTHRLLQVGPAPLSRPGGGVARVSFVPCLWAPLPLGAAASGRRCLWAPFPWAKLPWAPLPWAPLPWAPLPWAPLPWAPLPWAPLP